VVRSLRPDHIVISEVWEGKALDLLKAWNTGHPGGLATLHAHSAAEGLSRLGDVIGEVTQRIPHTGHWASHRSGDPHRAHTGRAARVGDDAGHGWEEGGYRLQAA
jgi:type IV secretion system protein VirB11